MKCFIIAFDDEGNESKILEFEKFDITITEDNEITITEDNEMINWFNIKKYIPTKDSIISIKFPKYRLNGDRNLNFHYMFRKKFEKELKSKFKKCEKDYINKIIKR